MIEREGGQEGDNVCVRGREKAGRRESGSGRSSGRGGNISAIDGQSNKGNGSTYALTQEMKTLTQTHTLSNTHTHTHHDKDTHTHTHTLSLFLTHTHTHTHYLSPTNSRCGRNTL